MYAELWCVVISVTLFAASDGAYWLTISPETDVTVDLGSTVTLACTAHRDDFWLAIDSVVWTKRQGTEDGVAVTSNNPTYSAAQQFASRYNATAVQPVPDTVAFKLTIHDFRHEDSGTYSCALVGSNSEEATPQQVILYSGLTAAVNLTSTASLEDDVYVYSYTRLQQTTTCDGIFYGTGSPHIQITYAGNEVTNDFQQLLTSYLEGETVGLKKPVQRLTYNASTYFYPSSEVTSALWCKALNDRAVVLNASSINVRSLKKPTLLCSKQDPQIVKSNDTDIRILCSLEGYTWEEDISAILWKFTITMADGQSKSVTLENGQSGYRRQALNDPNFPQLNIDVVDKDVITFTDYTVELTHNGVTVVSTRYKLQTDASSEKGQITGSGSRLIGAVFYIAFCGIMTSIAI